MNKKQEKIEREKTERRKRRDAETSEAMRGISKKLRRNSEEVGGKLRNLK